jgi:hypothetical protein
MNAVICTVIVSTVDGTRKSVTVGLVLSGAPAANADAAQPLASMTATKAVFMVLSLDNEDSAKGASLRAVRSVALAPSSL